MRGTPDTSWDCGIVGTTLIGVVSCGGYRHSCVRFLQLFRSWTCLITCRAEGGCVQALAKLHVSLSAGRAECGCVQALEKPDKLWIALDALRVESQLVNSLNQFCAQLVRS